MATYLMLGKYTVEALKGASADRTKKALDVIAKAGGKVRSMFALLGPYDLALIVDMPDNGAAIRVSADLAKMTGVGFTTSPTLSVEEFDKVIA
ncbi:MAG: GYD domain-containing protein [Deltaproteobacteria bacterium]